MLRLTDRPERPQSASKKEGFMSNIPERFEDNQPVLNAAPMQNVLNLQAQDLMKENMLAEQAKIGKPELIGLGYYAERTLSVVGTIAAPALSGYVFESASMAELRTLQTLNPKGRWNSFDAGSLGSVRSELQRTIRLNPELVNSAERDMVSKMQTRGLVKGIGIGFLAAGATIGVDMALFPKTPRTEVSHTVDMVGMPLVGIIPMNPYVKGAAIVALHTAGRAYDHFYGKK